MIVRLQTGKIRGSREAKARRNSKIITKNSPGINQSMSTM